MANQDISLSNYDPDAARIQRQQRLAQMLQEQSQQDIPINSYNGIQAPISPLSLIAKALQAYQGKKLADQADTQYGDLQTKRRKDLADMLTRQTQVPGTPDSVSAPYATPKINPDDTASGGDTGLAPIVAGTPARPTTPQEQLANALAMSQSNDPNAANMGMDLYKTTLQKQQQAPYYQSIISAAPAAVRPMLAQALAAGDTKTLDTYGATLAGKATPQAVNQSTEITPQQAGIDPKTLSPGAKLFKKPDGTIEVVKTSDMASQGRFGQEVSLAGARANATANAQTGGPTAPITVDPNSNSLNAQTGLSQMAIDRLTGAPNQPRAAAVVNKVNKEITDYSIKNNVNLATLRARATGINNVVQQNTQRNNQANILENEISGSVQNLAPILDNMHNNSINVGNVANIWAGRQVNDPNAQMAADQLTRFRSELAGYNAVAGGHLMDNGTPNPSPADYAAAEKTILGGINSGGAKAVAHSVGMSAQKNRAVLANSIDEANAQLWDAFGVGAHYKRQTQGAGNPPPPNAPKGPPPPPGFVVHP